MKKQQAVWKLVTGSLSQNIPVMLLYVLKSSGSSPGRQGFAMAVNALEEMEGSIGGGIMEHKFVEMAKEQLRQNAPTIDVRQQFHDKKAAKNQSGMICSGEQTILLYTVKPEEKTQIDQLVESLEFYENGLLRLSPQGIQFSNALAEKDYFFKMKSEYDWLYEEKTGYKNHVYIVGGGHCSLALSRLLYTLDFYIRIFDNRTELNTLAENCYAHQKTLVNDYTNLKHLVPSGKNHYVIIMTLGYRTDFVVLKSLIDKNFAYLGVLGSKKKIAEMFKTYIKAGTPPERLKKIYSPIGLRIKSQTPEEIAISITAQIIKVKNKHQP